MNEMAQQSLGVCRVRNSPQWMISDHRPIVVGVKVSGPGVGRGSSGPISVRLLDNKVIMEFAGKFSWHPAFVSLLEEYQIGVEAAPATKEARRSLLDEFAGAFSEAVWTAASEMGAVKTINGSSVGNFNLSHSTGSYGVEF